MKNYIQSSDNFNLFIFDGDDGINDGKIQIWIPNSLGYEPDELPGEELLFNVIYDSMEDCEKDLKIKFNEEEILFAESFI